MKKKRFIVKTTPKYLWFTFMLLPPALYYLVVFLFAVNIPLSDDFPSVLGFLDSFFSPGSIAEKIRLLFSQHNEHRIVFNRLVSLAVFKINGVMDFRLLIYIGNLLLLPALYAVYVSFKGRTDKLKYFLPAVLIIAVPQFTGSIFRATSALQNLSCLAFSLLSLALLKKESAASALTAFIFALFAVLSSGNGLFVLLSALLFLILVKRKKTAVLWAIGTALVFLGFFYGYTAPAHENIYYFSNAVKPLAPAEFFLVFIGSPSIYNVFYMKALLGNNAEIIIRFISALSGGTIIVYFIFLIKKKYYSVNPVIFSMFILFFITAFAAAVTRSGAGPMQAFVSRYRVIPVFIFALVYLSFIEIIKEKTVRKYFSLFVFTALLFSAFSYIANLQEIKNGRNNLVTGLAGWQRGKEGIERLNDDPVYAGKQLKLSVQKGIYLPEKMSE